MARDRDPYKYFRVEARELLEELSRGVLEVEKGSAGPAPLARLLRAAHTLKGAARVVRLPELARLVHEVEDVLAPHREHGAVPRADTDRVLQLLDQVHAQLAALDAPAAAPAASPPALAPAPAPAPQPEREEAPAPQESLPRLLPAAREELEGVLEGVAMAQSHLAALERAVGTVERLRRVTELLVDQLASPQARREGGAVLARVRTLVDELPGLVGAVDRELGTGVEQVDRELGQLRQSAERLQLAPAALLFGALERTARDAAQGLARRVTFDARGGDVRLDAQSLGVVQGALVQAVRNAVAHGIEPESERAAAGKPAAGSVAVEVQQRGARVLFVCSDDGRGVDLEAVRRAAVARGTPAPEAERMDREQLFALLLRGGLSTSAAVTAIAGRGVGLDVVREAAERLRGAVSVRSERGTGTQLELSIPASLSAVDALLVEASGRRAALPLEAVRRASRLEHHEVAWTAEGALVHREGAAVPFLRLERALRNEAPSRPRAGSVVLLERDGALGALGVDRLLGTRRVVVRALPLLALADPVCVGASFDAEGTPVPVLDPAELLLLARRGGAPAVEPAPQRPLLVIDDSLTTRMLEQSILESAGYLVDVAASAEEGLEKAQRRAYALVLCDVEMPGMDGFAFLERAREEPALRGVPTIMVTSRSAPEDRQRAEAAGARAYVVKSEFDQTALLERIRALVEGP